MHGPTASASQFFTSTLEPRTYRVVYLIGRPYENTVSPQKAFNPKETTMFNHVRLSSLSVTLGVALLAATAVPQLGASDLDKKTFMTFTAPVQVSGVTLPAGTYLFKTFSEDRNVVVVTNREETQVIATLHAVPIEASVIPDKARIELSEGTANAPEELRAWFYPGDSYGWSFPARTAGRNITRRNTE
jgi:hypothetical protein